MATLEWKDLIPASKPLKDPLSHLTPEQAISIDTIAWARGLTEAERGLDYNKSGIESARDEERDLKNAGIDIDGLIVKYKAWMAETDRRRSLVVNSLDGKEVKLAGYLLPLEFSEKGETEFLLVPYVGACIHAPAPPPNQVVFARLKQSYRAAEIFEPVWVSGLMKTKASSKTLSLVDGQSDVSIGYHISSGTVQPYKK